MTGPLADVRVLDLSRVLAGPQCTQILGDMGADVIKVERPGAGDDTRRWGPPFLADDAGRETSESAYYLGVNRNKRSVTVDITRPEGRDVILALTAKSDILVENFKVGDLARHGLGYPQMRERFPRLVYCSITGFGQDGPYARRPGYDFMAQAMGGIMSVTGVPDGEPMKVGVAVADIMTGMYAVAAILGALHHRDASGEGQHIDLALLDCQVAWLGNVGQAYLVSGEAPRRYGNAHPTVVPYQAFRAADDFFVLAVGNDAQFRRFCQVADAPALADDVRFATNAARVRNREALIDEVQRLIAGRAAQEWLHLLAAAGVPACPINTVPEALNDAQVRHRGMVVEINHSLASRPLSVIANPIRYSRTPVTYRTAPPVMGQDTDHVLGEVLGMGAAEIEKLRRAGVI